MPVALLLPESGKLGPIERRAFEDDCACSPRQAVLTGRNGGVLGHSLFRA